MQISDGAKSSGFSFIQRVIFSGENHAPVSISFGQSLKGPSFSHR
jgi:hypothetical protein